MLRGWPREHNCHMRTVIRAGRNGNGDGVVTDAITLWAEQLETRGSSYTHPRHASHTRGAYKTAQPRVARRKPIA